MKKVLLTSVALLSVFGAATVLAEGSVNQTQGGSTGPKQFVEDNSERAKFSDFGLEHVGDTLGRRTNGNDGASTVFNPNELGVNLTPNIKNEAPGERGMLKDRGQGIDSVSKEKAAAVEAEKAAAPTMKQTSAEAKKAAEKAAPKAAAKTLPNTGAIK